MLRVHGRAQAGHRLERGLEWPAGDHFVDKSVLDCLRR
jgi:hypothetical protein